jgi:hypothetical protein
MRLLAKKAARLKNKEVHDRCSSGSKAPDFLLKPLPQLMRCCVTFGNKKCNPPALPGNRMLHKHCAQAPVSLAIDNLKVSVKNKTYGYSKIFSKNNLHNTFYFHANLRCTE